MWIAKVKGEWYEVKDVVDQGPGKGNHYELLGLGSVPQEEIEDLDISASGPQVRKSITNARRTVKRAQEEVSDSDKDSKDSAEQKVKFNLAKAKLVAPTYWKDLKLDKYTSKIKSILQTADEPGTEDFYQAVYDYQMKDPEITLKDGIIGPETLGAMIKDDSSLAKEFQLSQSKSFEDFLSSNEEIVKGRESTFNLTRFKTNIGRLESSNKYDAVSPFSSATGKYQFIWSIWQKPISQFAGQAISREEFLSNPELQESFMDHYVKTNLVPEAFKLQKRFPKTSGKLTFEQLLGLLHFKGPGDAAKILAGLPDPTTKNNISVSKYLAKLI